MSGARVMVAHAAYRKPDDPANFITYAVAACVTFVGLGFLLYFCIATTDTWIKPLLVISAFTVFAVFIAKAVKYFLSPASRMGEIAERLARCEKTVLTFAAFFTLLLTMFCSCNTHIDRVFAIVLLTVIGVATVADIVVNLFDKEERRLIELFLFVIIGWACVIKLDRIAEIFGDLCFYMCLGGFAVYLIGTAVGSITSIKYRRLLNSFSVVLGTALWFVGIFLYVL